MGIVIIILAAKLKQAAIFQNDDEDVEKIGAAAFYIMIIFGCIAVVLSFLGVLTAKCNKCFCNACVSNMKIEDFMKTEILIHKLFIGAHVSNFTYSLVSGPS